MNLIQLKTLASFLGLLLLITLSSCETEGRNKGSREFVPNPEKYQHDGYAELSDSLKPKFAPDTSVGKICLQNSRNVDDYLGSDVMDRLVDVGLPHSSVLSSNGKQQLTYYFHPGGVKKEFSEFKVSYTNSSDSRTYRRSSDQEFSTETHIQLGMTMGSLRAIKGEPDSVFTTKTTTFHYRISDSKNSTFLKRYTMPLYYADYEFENGYLIQFQFGFEYP